MVWLRSPRLWPTRRKLPSISYNINVNALVPGYIVTEINKKEFENEKVYNSIVRKIPMRRLGSVEDVIGSVIFLASDASNYVTGAVIAADGGWLCE